MLYACVSVHVCMCWGSGMVIQEKQNKSSYWGLRKTKSYSFLIDASGT